MKERFIEIRFTYYIIKLLARFNYSVTTLDIIEAYCNVGNIDSTIIKQLMKQVRDNTGIINTYREEAVYIGRVNKISYRKLADMTGISLATQVRLNKYYDEHPEMYVGITKHLPDFEYEQVEKFMQVVDLMKEI